MKLTKLIACAISMFAFSAMAADETKDAPPVALDTGPSEAATFPIDIRNADGAVIASIAADGTIIGDKAALIALLVSRKGAAGPQDVLFALIVHNIADKK